MGANRTVIITAMYIAAVTFVNRAINGGNSSLTRILIGAYIWLLLLSLMDMFGGALSQLAGALAMLAAVYVTLTAFPWDKILTLAQGGAKK